MRILMAFDHVADGAAPDQADALAQARVVSNALEERGHEWMTLGVTLDLDAARDAIKNLQPDLVFNLVESLGGHGRLIHVVPALLDTMGIPYTGASAEAQFMTSHKTLAKQLMRAAGIPTPQWRALDQLRHQAPLPAGRWIIKSLWEHASVGLDEHSTIHATRASELATAIEQRLDRLGGRGFAEQYIDGREFNIAILAVSQGGSTWPVDSQPQLLPPTEIVFEGYAPDQPRIVDYCAKWDETSFSYRHTVRRFDFEEADSALLSRLNDMAIACWRAFGLTGYARVDFRVDADNRPWVLEVNTNPCLSPDAGFVATLERAGVPYTRAIERIVNDALSRSRQCSPTRR